MSNIYATLLTFGSKTLESANEPIEEYLHDIIKL